MYGTGTSYAQGRHNKRKKEKSQEKELSGLEKKVNKTGERKCKPGTTTMV